MRKFLFATLAFAALCFAGCDNKNETDYPPADESFVFVDSYMTFTYDLKGDVAEMVDVKVSSTLPASNGNLSTSKEGTKHIVTISSIKCPTAFDLKFQLVPMEGISLDENTVYDYQLDCNFTIVRRFSDGRYILGNSETAPTLKGEFLGSKAEEFLKMNGTNVFTFGLSADGYYEEVTVE